MQINGKMLSVNVHTKRMVRVTIVIWYGNVLCEENMLKDLNFKVNGKRKRENMLKKYMGERGKS